MLNRQIAMILRMVIVYAVIQKQTNFNCGRYMPMQMWKPTYLYAANRKFRNLISKERAN